MSPTLSPQTASRALRLERRKNTLDEVRGREDVDDTFTCALFQPWWRPLSEARTSDAVSPSSRCNEPPGTVDESLRRTTPASGRVGLAAAVPLLSRPLPDRLDVESELASDRLLLPPSEPHLLNRRHCPSSKQLPLPMPSGIAARIPDRSCSCTHSLLRCRSWEGGVLGDQIGGF